MSATVPISTPQNHQLTLNNDSNPNSSTTHKRVIAIAKKKQTPETNGSPSNNKALILSGHDLSHTIRGESILKDSSPQTVPAGPVRKKKPLSKNRSNLQIAANLLVKFCAFAMFVSWIGTGLYNWYEGKPIISTGTPEERLSQVEASLKKTSKMLQMQVDIVDKKIGSEISKTHKDLMSKLEETNSFVQSEIQKLEGHNNKINQLLTEFSESGFVSKQEFQEFIEEFRNSKSGNPNPGLDEIRLFAKQMVEREINRHAADGLGMVDYALYSGGARVVRHSEPYTKEKGAWSVLGKGKVHGDAKKMLEPSFGEPGMCFALKGSEGFVELRLRSGSGIVVQAFTIEHVDKSVAYDRSSAPKTVRISGWYKGEGLEDEFSEQKVFLLADITYDLSKPNAQTFTVDPVNSDVMVNTVRFEFLDNHGNDDVTCIYRFRVHGHEPGSPSMIGVSD
ncbi:hypothetical protein LUZ60_015445 [Juncus effusus]|nr:hypothetical protein LUZ60_015445 [Juncus effusus]